MVQSSEIENVCGTRVKTLIYLFCQDLIKRKNKCVTLVNHSPITTLTASSITTKSCYSHYQPWQGPIKRDKEGGRHLSKTSKLQQKVVTSCHLKVTWYGITDFFPFSISLCTFAHIIFIILIIVANDSYEFLFLFWIIFLLGSNLSFFLNTC